MSLATIPLWWLSTDALRKAAKSGIKQSAAAQSLQVNIHNLDLNMTDQLKQVDADLAKGALTPEKADLYRTQIETEGKRLVGVAETQYTAKAARDLERVNRPMKKFPSQQGPSLFKTLMPPGALDTFRAYPDTQATKQARSVAEGINRRLNARKITPDQAREELRQMNAYAEHAERQAGDVVGQAQESAIEATESRKLGPISEDQRVDPTDAQRVVEEEANKATSVAQGPGYEQDLISGTGKNRVVRKIRPGARINVEARRKAWREAGRKGTEPKLGPDDYYRKGTTPEPYQEGAGSQRMTPESTEFEPLHEKTIREREERLRAKKKAEANAYDPIEAELRRLGRRPGDKAAKSARYQAERRAMSRDDQWNDAELAVIARAKSDEVVPLVEERLRKLRQEGKRVVQKEDGTFVISSERSLLGGEDMPDVDSDFLKSGKESDARMGRQRGPVGPARNVKLSPEELSTLRLNQIRQAKPSVSGSATPADRLRDLNTQIRDIEAKLDGAKTLERRFPGVDDGTLQRELRYDLAQALDGREQLLRKGRKPQPGRFAELDELEAEADNLLAPDVTAAKRKVAAPERQVKPPPPTDPRAINRTRRERLAEASEARADVEKPKTVDSLPRLGKARAGKPGAAEPPGGGADAQLEELNRRAQELEQELDYFQGTDERGNPFINQERGVELELEQIEARKKEILAGRLERETPGGKPPGGGGVEPSALLTYVQPGWLKNALETGRVPAEAAEKIADLERQADFMPNMQIRRELAAIENAHRADFMQSPPPSGGIAGGGKRTLETPEQKAERLNLPNDHGLGFGPEPKRTDLSNIELTNHPDGPDLRPEERVRLSKEIEAIMELMVDPDPYSLGRIDPKWRERLSPDIVQRYDALSELQKADGLAMKGDHEALRPFMKSGKPPGGGGRAVPKTRKEELEEIVELNASGPSGYAGGGEYDADHPYVTSPDYRKMVDDAQKELSEIIRVERAGGIAPPGASRRADVAKAAKERKAAQAEIDADYAQDEAYQEARSEPVHLLSLRLRGWRRDALNDLDQVGIRKEAFRDDPEMLKEALRIQSEALNQSILPYGEYMYENLPEEAIIKIARELGGGSGRKQLISESNTGSGDWIILDK